MRSSHSRAGQERSARWQLLDQMDESERKPTLLDELDAEQDFVLRELDELNARIEGLIQQYSKRPIAGTIPPVTRPAIDAA